MAIPRDPLILTIDIGSSSTRALLFDQQAQLLPQVQVQEPYTIHTSADGAAELDPAELLERVERCIDAALAQAGPLAERIAAVAVDTIASTFLPLDHDHQPLTRVMTYADTRNGPDSLTLRRSMSESTVHERTGCLLRTSYWPARIAWFQRTQPELWQRTAAIVTLGAYLEQRLFGRGRSSYSAASWTGMLDRRKLEWDAPLCQDLGCDAALLGPLADASEPLQGLLPEYAARWPALRDLPWFPALGDGAAANVGSGCVGPQRIALTVGTTGALRMALPDVEQVPAGLWCYRVDRELMLLGGATSEGGNVYAWLHQTFRLEESDESLAQISAMPPDSHGLTILPFVAGERSPGWAGDVRATIQGLSLATTPPQIARAALEAVAYRFGLIADALFDQEGGEQTVIASGGALLQSPLWLQIIADVLGRPVVVSVEPEATSRGVALIALRALGVIPALDTLPVALGDTYHPDPARHTIYRSAMRRQQQLYHQLIHPEG